MQNAYPYTAVPEPKDGFFNFPDVPEALTGAETNTDIDCMAQGALVAALSICIDADRPTSAPSSSPRLAQVPVLVALKLALHDAMLAQGVSNMELARRMGTDEKAVRRMQDPLQATKVDSLETVLRRLGRRAGADGLSPVKRSTPPCGA